ncbi:MAG: serine--tRNA ligase [Bacteroidota bacterium]
MLELNFIRNNKERLLEGLKTRNAYEEGAELVEKVIAFDDERKKLQTQLDQSLSERNRLSKEIGMLYKQGKREEADQLKQEVSNLKSDYESVEEKLKEVSQQVADILLKLPNVPHPSVPSGNTDEDNEVFQAYEGELPVLPDDALPHWELAEKYNLFDLKLGTKITGSGFPLYRGKGARLERALINFFLDEAHKAGYEEIMPPLMVNEDTARATGQLPDKEGQMYYIEKDDLYMIPTAEVPLTNIYRDVILDEKDFPIKLTGFTPCFRREAGSYGAHVRGLNRVHQFNKVEIVQIQHPEKSYDTLQEMLKHVANLLDKLELPYRILRLCGGDLGFTSALTFDFEVYSAAQKRWLEVSSVSNFETYQSNRLKLRFRSPESKKTQLAHTLNGSALALARIVASLLENHQTADGIVLPAAIRDYAGFEKID